MENFDQILSATIPTVKIGKKIKVRCLDGNLKEMKMISYPKKDETRGILKILTEKNQEVFFDHEQNEWFEG